MPSTLALAIIAASASLATGFADLDTIDRQVAEFAGAGIGEPGGAATPVDRRLRLRACQSGTTLSWRTAQRDSVLVQCADKGGWRIFVPVRRAEGAGAFAGPGGAGSVVTRGDAVAIAVMGEGFSVSQPGEALEGGSIGAWIRVRPIGRAGTAIPREVMRARIERPGLVSIPLP